MSMTPVSSTGSAGLIYGIPSDLVSTNIQSLIEMSYIQTANQVLGSQMASLENGLQVTQNVMNTLTALQNEHNEISTTTPTASAFDYAMSAGGVAAYESAYTAYASSLYGKPITPTFNYVSANAAGFANFQQNLIAEQTNLKAQITQLSAITPALSNGQPDPNALLAKLKSVLSDLNNFNLNTYSGVKAWVLDSYNVPESSPGAAKAGAIQQDLTDAITASESLNDTQKQNVQSYLYIFQQYYQSATSILQALTQILQDMATNIKTQ